MGRPQKLSLEEDFYQDVDRARLSSGWSCGLVIALLVVLYGLGGGILWLLLR